MDKIYVNDQNDNLLNNFDRVKRNNSKIDKKI